MNADNSAGLVIAIAAASFVVWSIAVLIVAYRVGRADGKVTALMDAFEKYPPVPRERLELARPTIIHPRPGSDAHRREWERRHFQTRERFAPGRQPIQQTQEIPAPRVPLDWQAMARKRNNGHN